MRTCYVWLLFCVIGLGFYSCSPKSSPGVYESMEQYAQAIDGYKKLYKAQKVRTEKAKLAYKIGELQAKNYNYKQADDWFTIAAALGYSDVKLHYQLAEAKKMNEKYLEALKEFEIYEKEVPGDPKVTEEKKLVKEAMDWKTNPQTRFVVDNFKLANTPNSEWAPFLKKDILYFTSDRPGTTGNKVFGRTNGAYSDIFFMERKYNGKDKKTVKWTAPALLAGDVNTIMNEGTAYVDAKGNTMYYTQCNGAKGDSIRNCVVMMAENKGKGWGAGTVLPFCVDTSSDYGQPAISPDGQRLVFSSDIPGGEGKHDLYLSTYVKRSHTWSDPINLGKTINTDGDEMFPYWLNDTTLYFSSNGLPGMGGMDIFVTTGRNPNWSKPKNLKYPINSGGNDISITYDEGQESGFFASDRLHGLGQLDIYTFYITPLTFSIRGTVYNTLTNLPERGVSVKLEGNNGTKLEATTNDSGNYYFKLFKNEQYQVVSKKKNFFNSKPVYATTVGFDLSQHYVRKDMFVTPQEGPPIEVAIHYDLDKANIRDDAKPVLDSLVGVMNEYPYIVVELSSHTDCRSSYAYNDTLSQKRADSAVTYMVKKGVDADRLVAKGYGERQLKNNCACEDGKGPGMDCTEAEHQVNRRTEIKVLRSDYVPKHK